MTLLPFWKMKIYPMFSYSRSHLFHMTNARRLAAASSRSWPHIVAVLKLKNCKGSALAQALQFWLLVTTIPVWRHGEFTCENRAEQKWWLVIFVSARDAFIPPLCMWPRVVVIIGRVDAPIVSRHVLWVVHTNKCGSIQLLASYYTTDIRYSGTKLQHIHRRRTRGVKGGHGPPTF